MWTAGADITREEHLHLLDAAKKSNDERAYLLVKLFASCDLPVQQLGRVTVEEVKSGEIRAADRTIHLPESLQ